MIISRTPYRLSFFGGGTDYPAWYREHGGAVLTSTIDHYCYITCRYLPPFFEHKSRVVWSKIERVTDNCDIEHPVVKSTLEFLNIDQGVEIHHDGDLPSRAGLGSSSAFTVGLLNALYALKGQQISKMDLAQLAIHVEQSLLKENVGVQDQIQTAHGGLNRIQFLPNDAFQIDPIILSEEKASALEGHLLLFYTGVTRHASKIAKAQIDAIPNKTNELREMAGLVDQGLNVLSNGSDITDFGRLLHESWELKRSLSDKIAPDFINEIYGRGRRAGALGGKILGAGGGGFILFFVKPEDHPKILEALSELLLVPFHFDYSGSQIIFYDNPRYSRTALSGMAFRRYGTHDNNDNEGGNRQTEALADAPLPPLARQAKDR